MFIIYIMDLSNIKYKDDGLYFYENQKYRLLELICIF